MGEIFWFHNFSSWDSDPGWLVKNLDTGEERHPDVNGRMIVVANAIFVGTRGGPNHIKHVDYGTCFKNQLVNNGISP